jgi:hypothetical protein
MYRLFVDVLKDVYTFSMHNLLYLRTIILGRDASILELFRSGILVKKSYISSESSEILRVAIDDSLNRNVAVWESDDGSDSRIYGFESIFDFSLLSLDVNSMREFGEKYLGKKLKYYIVVAGRLSAVDGNIGSGGGWHRDSPFRHQFKVIIYLSCVSASKGPFQYIVHSHKLKEKVRLGGVGNSKTRFSEELVSTISAAEVQEMVGSPGDAIFVDTRGIHRGRPIEDGVRYAITFYFFESTPSNHIVKLTQSGFSELGKR